MTTCEHHLVRKYFIYFLLLLLLVVSYFFLADPKKQIRMFLFVLHQCTSQPGSFQMQGTESYSAQVTTRGCPQDSLTYGGGDWRVCLLMGNTCDTTTETIIFCSQQGVRGPRSFLKSKVAHLSWERKSATHANLVLKKYLFRALAFLLALLISVSEK